MLNGRTICLRNIDIKKIFELIDKYKVTHFGGAPIVLNMITGAPETDRKKLKGVLFVNNNLHVELIINPYAFSANNDPIGLSDLVIESAVSTIIDHEDSNTRNNHVDNLRWCSHIENQHDRKGGDGYRRKKYKKRVKNESN